MKNPIYRMAYYAGYYKTRIIAVMKIALVLAFTLLLISIAMKVFDLSIEIKRSGDNLWLIK